MSNASSYTNRDPRYDGLAEWLYPERALLTYAQVLLNPLVYALEGVVGGVQRRWRRERRRRLVGRSYDMATELARVLPRGSRVLDVGCGSGFIAHHLSALLGARVSGIDVRKGVDAPIDYAAFDGTHFPAEDRAFDAVLLCYVLHHTQDQLAFMREVRRVLRDGGLAIVYEDIPEAAWDAAACRAHDRAWRSRTGPCTFRLWEEWRRVFNSAGFEVVSVRRLSRWRNLTHPVRRGLYVLRASGSRRSPV
ncbi:MAG TPA: class I SAM-dependent methyltransferase [Pyrinomonadaceae bacterium]|nr:class I SAM-dependent methyltransferase [Pyrinomonadaceae bacterium]